MGKIGKISVIPKDFGGAFPTMEKSLRDSGRSRFPGTYRMFLPFRELNGKYRTGLDDTAKYLEKVQDKLARETEKQKIKEIRESLEKATGIELDCYSTYYDYTAKRTHKVQPVKLEDGDNIFNLEDPWQAITFHWLKAYPGIASSLQAWKNGEYPADTQYFVNDEDLENEIEYRKKKTANDAIIRFDSWTLEKRKKVARLLDLPVDENTKEQVVYNMVDSFLKAQQVPTGVHKGRDPIKVFGSYAQLKDDVIYIKDLVEQCFKSQIYKEKKGGKVYEGELEVYRSKDELIEHLLDDKNQEDVIEIEKKLKIRKLAEV